jgi:membrane protease YdiL (CAAX protease family)
VLFLAGSSAFSLAVTLVAAWLLQRALPSAAPLLPALLAPPPLALSAAWTLPLLASLAAALYGCERNIPALVEIRDLLRRSLLPLLTSTPGPGIALIALGAGVSEEALFRGALLPIVAAALTSCGFGTAAAFAAASVASSVLFAALHAVTPLYFWWALFAGLLFCAELALTGSLSACLMTHFAYDAIAMGVILSLWGAKPPPAGL